MWPIDSLNTTGARLAAALLGYFTLVIVLLTLSPFYFELPRAVALDLRVRPGDILENVTLFLPLGFLYRLSGGRWRGATLLGLALSAAIEAAQICIPVRTAAPIDVLSNTLGASVGAWAYGQIVQYIDINRDRVGRLSLEIPLMGLLYLLVPLLWASALASAGDPSRWGLMALLGVCGAIVLSDITRAWWGPARPRDSWRVALAAAGWFTLGGGPGLLRVPQVLPAAAGVGLLAAALATLPWHAADRRFERSTLRRIVPLLGLYLALAALWPPLQPLGPWHATLGLTDRVEPILTRIPAPLLEQLLAFTALGYLGAEWRGRDELPLARDLPRLLGLALGAALAVEGLAGFQAGHGASLIRLTLVVAGALAGGVIYHVLRGHVRYLLRR